MTGLVTAFRGRAPRLGKGAFVAPNATVIGDVEIGADSSVWYGCVLRGDVQRIRIGCGTNIQDGTVIHVNHDRDGRGGDPTNLGDGVTVGHMALLHACTVGDGAFIGMRAVIMDHAVIEAGAMVAGGALVTPRTVVPAGQLWAGAPARHMRDLSPSDRDDMAYAAANYVKLAAEHLALGRGEP